MCVQSCVVFHFVTSATKIENSLKRPRVKISKLKCKGTNANYHKILKGNIDIFYFEELGNFLIQSYTVATSLILI